MDGGDSKGRTDDETMQFLRSQNLQESTLFINFKCFSYITVSKHFSDIQMKAIIERSICYDLVAVFCLFFYLS